MKKGIAILLVLFVVATVFIPSIHAQPRFWFALNFELFFYPDGTVKVKQKLHPFAETGESLYGQANITTQLKENEADLIIDSLLLFATKPKNVKYEVVSHVHEDDEELVLCDVYGTGEMVQFRGAYVIEILIYLNTTDSIKQIGDYTYRVSIRDSFTSRDPRSWIDVMEIILDPQVKLISYSWEPKLANDASEVSETRLLWINYNEPEAPNAYILDLYIPGLKLQKKIVGYKVKIEDVKVKDNGVKVAVRQLGKPGYFFVRLTDGELDVTRKIYLRKGERKTVFIPAPIKGKEQVKIEVWYEDSLIDSKIVNLKFGNGGLKPSNGSTPSIISLKPFTVTLIVVAIIILAAIVILVVKAFTRKKPLPPPPPPEYQFS